MSDFDLSLFKHSYRIDKVGILKKHQDFENVVCEIRHYVDITYEVSKNAKYETSIFRVINLNLSDMENFVPHEQLTHETYIKWIDMSSDLNLVLMQAKEQIFPNKYYVDYKEQK
jgi:hypothetical protein